MTFCRKLAWEGGKLPKSQSGPEQALYRARLNRKRILSRARGRNHLSGDPQEVLVAPKEWRDDQGRSHEQRFSEQQSAETSQNSGVAHFEPVTAVAKGDFSPDVQAAAVKAIQIGLKRRGFANAAEAFAFFDANGEHLLTEVELTNGLHRLRLAEAGAHPAALMAAAEAGGCHDGKIEYREFLRHFAWPEGRVGGDAEKVLYEATLARRVRPCV